jgi:hypothetical protein
MADMIQVAEKQAHRPYWVVSLACSDNKRQVGLREHRHLLW